MRQRLPGGQALGGQEPMTRDIVDDRLLGALHLRALTREGFAHDPVAEHVAFQAGTLDSLMAGRFDGDATMAEMLAHGDLGIGTVEHLGGELVVLDGEAFVVKGDGRVRPVPGTVRTPFCVVAQFSPVARTTIEMPTTLADLHEVLDALADPEAGVVALRVDGSFEALRLRSVHTQRPPYPPLSEVTEHQTEWLLSEAEGTLVGFRFLGAAAGVEVPGYHLHFLSSDRAHGGHVLDVVVRRASVAIDGGNELHVELPAGIGLGVPGAADRAAIRRIEGG